MPKISKKGEIMPSSPIRKLVPFAEGAKKRGLKVYHLNIGQPDIASPSCALDGIHNYNEKVIEYSHSAGNASLRKAISDYYKRQNIEIGVDEMIVTTGATEAIQIAMGVCFNPGDEIIIPEPYYANYNSFAINAGVTVVPIKSNIEDGFALPPIAEFEKVITERTKAIMVCNPNNPTGYLYSKEELEVLKKLALKYDLYLFADEVYREFVYDGFVHTSLMHLEGLDQNVILFDSVSKRYSECGLRVGCILSKNKAVIASAMKFAQARLSPPSLGQVAAETSYNYTTPEYFTEVVGEYLKRRNIVVERINKMDGAFCPNPKGAFYVVASLPIDDSDVFCQWLLEDFSFNNETVMMAPATGFYSKPELGKKQVRISYVLKTEDLNGAMNCLEEALKVYPGRTK